jgi:hypothetical protein
LGLGALISMKVMFIYIHICGAAPSLHTLNNNEMTQ